MIRRFRLSVGAVLAGIAFTVVAAEKLPSAALDDALDDIEASGKIVGELAACSTSASILNKITETLVSANSAIYGKDAKPAIARAVAKGRALELQLTERSAESCGPRLYLGGKFWQQMGLIVAARTRDLSYLPARITTIHERHVLLAADIGYRIYPALEGCIDHDTALIFIVAIRDVHKRFMFPSGKPIEEFFEATSGEGLGGKFDPKHCPDALVTSGAFSQLLEDAEDSTDSTPESRWVMRRALALR